MKPYANKFSEIDDRKCLFVEIRANEKPRKVANRRDAKKEILSTIQEDEEIAQASFLEYVQYESGELN